MSAPTRIAVVTDAPDLVRSVERGAGAEGSVTHVPDLAELVEDDAHYDVVVAGPPCGTRLGLGALAAYHERAPRTSILLAFDRPHVHTRDIVWVGADALVEPDAPEAVEVAVQRSLTLARGRVTDVAAELARREAPLGRTFTVCSATGGCGKTFYATNLAFFLAQWTGARVALVDLDLQFGEVTAAMRLKVKHTISDALAAASDEGDGLAAHLDELVTHHESGVDVLPAPRRPDEADRITPAEIGQVVEVLQGAYDYVVVDTPTGLGEGVLAAMDRSERLFLLATLDVPSVRNLRLFVDTLGRLEISDESVSLVLNKAQKGNGIEPAEVERIFGRGFQAVLPYAPEVPKSVSEGQPVLASSPEAEISQLLAGGVAELLPEDARAAFDARSAPSGRRSLTDRFRRVLGRDGTSPATPQAPPPATPPATPRGADA